MTTRQHSVLKYFFTSLRKLIRFRICFFLFPILPGMVHSATLQVFSSEATFLANAPIISTQTFDSFATDSGIDAYVTNIDGVVYGIDNPKMFAACDPLPCWRFGDGLSDGPPPVSAPNYLFSSYIGFGEDEAESLSFGDGRFARALGFYLQSAISAAWLAAHSPDFLGWEIIVNEVNGDSSTFFVDPSVAGDQQTAPPYFGFLSETGISDILIFATAASSSSPNWAYDNVSHSAVIPLPTSLLSFGIAISLLGFTFRKKTASISG